MITRLEVDGFKSLQGFAVDLEPFDPKQRLHELHERRRRPQNYYVIFGEQVSFEKLRRLPAFR